LISGCLGSTSRHKLLRQPHFADSSSPAGKGARQSAATIVCVRRACGMTSAILHVDLHHTAHPQDRFDDRVRAASPEDTPTVGAAPNYFAQHTNKQPRSKIQGYQKLSRHYFEFHMKTHRDPMQRASGCCAKMQERTSNDLDVRVLRGSRRSLFWFQACGFD
jgi:hypothetical protein